MVLVTSKYQLPGLRGVTGLVHLNPRGACRVEAEGRLVLDVLDLRLALGCLLLEVDARESFDPESYSQGGEYLSKMGAVCKV